MNKEENNKLCQLLGIEPIYNCDNCETSNYYGRICNLDYQPVCKVVNIIYPDLLSPNNFIQLFNFKLKNGATLLGIFNSWFSPYSFEHYLEILLRCLADKNSELYNPIIEQAKQAKFDYSMYSDKA